MSKSIKILLLSLALTPLFVDNSVFYPFVTAKTMFLRMIICLVSILFLFSFLLVKRFREQITDKVSKLVHSSFFIFISVFILISIISTIFATDKYIAFWGDLTRAEGLVGLIFFFSVFLFTALIFEKKDWLSFFKLNIIISTAVLIKEFIQYFGGVSRPDSFVGVPTFLAGYLLFVIFSAIFIISEAKNKLWKYFGILIIILSSLGIFITQTRGTIAGLGLGFISIIVYTILKYKNTANNFNYRKLAIVGLSLVVLFSIFFVSTRKSEIWQKVPGFSRIAQINLEDSTTQTRLLNIKLGAEAINPMQNGWKNFIIGWGPDNFSQAYQKYFNPEQFNYKMEWLDRAHNKVIDLAVMNGILGLLSYLSIYIILFILIIKKKDFSLINVGLVFILTSFFVHLLFVFDNVTTSVMSFMILSFSSYLIIDNKGISYKSNNIARYLISSFWVILTAFLIFVFLRGDLLSYIQMRKYSSFILKRDSHIILSDTSYIFEPFTVAQMNIRSNLLSFIEKSFDKDNESIVELSDIATKKGEEYMNRNTLDLRFLVLLANDYTLRGYKLKNKEFLIKGEVYYKQAISLITNRPDFIYGLALNMYYQGRYNEAFVNFEKSFDISPRFYQEEGDNVESIYTFFMQYFYEKRDKENFIKVADRLKENNYVNGGMLDKVIEYMNKYNKWPNIDFNHK